MLLNLVNRSMFTKTNYLSELTIPRCLTEIIRNIETELNTKLIFVLPAWFTPLVLPVQTISRSALFRIQLCKREKILIGIAIK